MIDLPTNYTCTCTCIWTYTYTCVWCRYLSTPIVHQVPAPWARTVPRQSSWACAAFCLTWSYCSPTSTSFTHSGHREENCIKGFIFTTPQSVLSGPKSAYEYKKEKAWGRAQQLGQFLLLYRMIYTLSSKLSHPFTQWSHWTTFNGHSSNNQTIASALSSKLPSPVFSGLQIFQRILEHCQTLINLQLTGTPGRIQWH